jgi:hypothetical protein
MTSAAARDIVGRSARNRTTTGTRWLTAQMPIFLSISRSPHLTVRPKSIDCIPQVLEASGRGRSGSTGA